METSTITPRRRVRSLVAGALAASLLGAVPAPPTGDRVELAGAPTSTTAATTTDATPRLATVPARTAGAGTSPRTAAADDPTDTTADGPATAPGRSGDRAGPARPARPAPPRGPASPPAPAPSDPDGVAENDPADRAPLPVPYGPAALLAAGATGTGAPAGANDFACRPSADKPNPVVLVHGLGASMGANFPTLSPLLHNAGYCVFALTYGARADAPLGGGILPMEQSAPELAAFVDEVLAATGADQVDLVGHSQGTVMPQVFLKRLGGDVLVDRYVALTPLYDGTTLYAVADVADLGRALFPPLLTGVESGVGVACGSCPQFLRGSPFLTDLYGDGVAAVPGVTYTTIMTQFDGVVVPWHSGFLRAENATDIVLQEVCPSDVSDHLTVAFNPNVGNLILDALDPDRAEGWSCEPFLPLLGSPGPLGPVVDVLRTPLGRG